LPAAVAIFVMSVGALAPAGTQEKLPPLRTGVDGTFAPHAFPKLGGGIQGFNVDLFIEVAKRMKWFGRVPPPDALERTITPGYGVPGMPGYDPTLHELHCG
jgi:ABC-type amino acid transport substrate-binding protein